MTNAERTIADDCGFQIIDRGDRILFINRRTLGPAVAAWVLGGIAFITGVNGVIFAALIFGGVNPAPWYLPVYMAGASIAFVFAARKAFGVYRRRRDAAVDNVPGNLFALTGSAVLADDRRATLAPLADVRVKTGHRPIRQHAGADANPHAGLARRVAARLQDEQRRRDQTRRRGAVRPRCGRVSVSAPAVQQSPTQSRNTSQSCPVCAQSIMHWVVPSPSISSHSAAQSLSDSNWS